MVVFVIVVQVQMGRQTEPDLVLFLVRDQRGHRAEQPLRGGGHGTDPSGGAGKDCPSAQSSTAT